MTAEITPESLRAWRVATMIALAGLIGWHLGYRAAKLANGLPVELGLLDLVTAISVAVMLWAIHAMRPDERV
ncbi:MAG: hypothetical protein ACU0BF_06850 [Paracoccaceae bacterium]